jgi:hypothetical protein
MTPEQFAYWLQGFAELNPQAPTAEQWQAIRDHLNLVFKKETPVRVAGPAVAEPARNPLDEAIRRLNERDQVFGPRPGIPFQPNHPYWQLNPVITC